MIRTKSDLKPTRSGLTKAQNRELRRTVEPEKAAAAAVFYERYVTARYHEKYRRLKKRHQELYEKL